MHARQGRHPIQFMRLRHSALDVDAFLLWAGDRDMTSSNVMIAMRDAYESTNLHFVKAMKLAIEILKTTELKGGNRVDVINGDVVVYNGRSYANNVMEHEPDQLAMYLPHKDGGCVEVGLVSTSWHFHHLDENWELDLPKGVRQLTAFLLNRKKLTKGFHRRFNRAVVAYWFELTDN